jgi:hypothetical protein
MPLREETYDLRDELARLEADDEAPLQHERGVRWAAEDAVASPVGVWDEAVDSVTLGGLDAGEMAVVKNRLADADGGGVGMYQLHVVAAGTVAAPYAADGDDHEQSFAKVCRLPESYVAWAYARIDELSTVGAAGGLEGN